MTIAIHILRSGFPLCRFSGKVPGQWPIGNVWIRESDYRATAEACRDPAHELHAVLSYRMCEGCETALDSDLPDLPIIPSEGRTCEHCGAPLVAAWPAVYCSNECALADAEPP